VNHRSQLIELFALFKDPLPLAAFGGAPYSLDETGIVECVSKTGCVVGARAQIANKMSVDLSNVDRGAHEATGDHGSLRFLKWDV
jgi:hypothetical protein